MKFPKKLSPERLSLLSPEDRKIYNQEHGRSSVQKKNRINESVSSIQFEELDEDEKRALDKIFDNDEVFEDSLPDAKDTVNEFVSNVISEELDNMFNEMMSDCMTREEYEVLKEELMNVAMNSSEDDSSESEEILSEDLITEGQPGYDAGEWIRGFSPNLKGLGKWIGAGLGALGVGLGYLITVGKDKLAMMRLKKYMNRLVEIVDQGIYKRRPWLSFLTWGNTRKNWGEYNNGCFRTIQEAADRDMCVSVMSAAKKLGFFGPGSMMDVTSHGQIQDGGGLKAFEHNLVDNIQQYVKG